MKKKIGSIIAICTVMVGVLFILTGCTGDKVDISELTFDPKGIWVDISDGELMFELYSNGTLEYGADELGTWKVVGKNLINVSLGDDGNYNIDLIQYEGYNLIGNENATFCLQSDYDNVHNDVYLPSIAEPGDSEEPEDFEGPETEENISE